LGYGCSLTKPREFSGGAIHEGGQLRRDIGTSFEGILILLSMHLKRAGTVFRGEGVGNSFKMKGVPEIPTFSDHRVKRLIAGSYFRAEGYGFDLFAPEKGTFRKQYFWSHIRRGFPLFRGERANQNPRRKFFWKKDRNRRGPLSAKWGGGGCTPGGVFTTPLRGGM